MRIVQKPWGHEEIWAETPNYVGKVLVINPGHKLSRQYHNLKEESFRVLEGTLYLEVGEPETPEFRSYTLYPEHSFHCPPKTIHRMICHAGNEKAVKVLEVSTNHLDDVIRLEDDYKR